MRVLLASVVLCLSVFSKCNPVTENQHAMIYLQKYGYLEEGRSGSLSEDTAVEALKDFQRFAGLKQTGKLDNETLTMMRAPRCGVKDIISHSDLARRKKRYAHQGSKWRSKRLTYRISRYPTRLKDRQKVDKEITKAFKVWSDITSLRFEERKRGRVNIDVRFEKREHGDGDPFDGPGDKLAHAFFPNFGGDAHFDDEEIWTIEGRRGTNLFQVAAHEFGHTLGLEHSDEQKALMYPYYHDLITIHQNDSFILPKDDVIAIQSLYGKTTSTDNNIKESPSDDDPIGPPTDTSDAPDLCQDAIIDTVTRTQNGSTYVFRGDFYWKILTEGIADGYPRRIAEDWDGLEGNLDASLTWLSGKTFFFKDSRYWRFTNRQRDPGYPKLISDGFEGIPDDLDAAFLWSGNGKTYFFKGSQFWRYDSNDDPPVSNKYPRPISNWGGLPNDIDAAFQWGDFHTYFFKGNKYYRLNDKRFAVHRDDPAYPRSTARWWFGCRAISHRTDATKTPKDAEETTPPSKYTNVRRRRPLNYPDASRSSALQVCLPVLFASTIAYFLAGVIY